MRIIGVIPSRYGSTRLPGKPLKDICGKSMVQRVYEAVQEASLVDEVIVATDDESILEEVGRADVVLSDMAPNLTGNYGMDQARSVWLAQTALSVAGQVLTQGGNMVCKVFMGEEYPNFLNEVRHEFRMVKAFSPKASRKHSSETYVIAKNFTGSQ